MIELTQQHYISEGLARKVYRHPLNENLCIKIGKPEIKDSHLVKELNYLKKIQKKGTKALC